VVLVGNAGVTAAVIREVELALARHELIKIRLPGVARNVRTEMVRNICETTGSEMAQEIGRVAVLYRPAEKPRLTFPE
jgi:RNA-binding protein